MYESAQIVGVGYMGKVCKRLYVKSSFASSEGVNTAKERRNQEHAFASERQSGRNERHVNDRPERRR